MSQSKSILILACLFAVFPAGARSQSPNAAPGQKAPAPTAAATAKVSPAGKTAAFDPALLKPAMLIAKAPDVYEAKFSTTAGDFVVMVTRAWAPRGADRFYNLVKHHFYDGAAFFRVLPGFMAQFGISAYPEVSKTWQEAVIKDDPVVQSNHRGYLSFAMAGPNTRTTQVFINFGNNEALDKMGFSAFGMVTDGMDVVDKLYSGYGEGAPDGKGPDQGLVAARGRAYLAAGFPKLDSIKTATLVTPAPAGK